ncbi:DAK2 domain-containing protein [Streptomyces sp. NPDC059373]
MVSGPSAPDSPARGPPATVRGSPKPPDAVGPLEDHVPVTHTLDAAAVRAWCRLTLQALGRAREEIDAINVYPVADGDTGTNLYLTVESAAESLEASADHTDLPQVLRAMSQGALIGARGNSGTILAQLLRGMTGVLVSGGGLAPALREAADSAYQAVAHPVEGTMLTVAAAAAEAVTGVEGDLAVARAAYEAARSALAATPGQLAELGRAGVVDAGGRGLVAVLGALADALSGREPAAHAVMEPTGTVVPFGCGSDGDPHVTPGGPAYEVIYLLEAADPAVPALREALDGLGDSLVVVGGDGLWNVHVHVDDVGAAVEAGIAAGRPYRIKVTHFGDQVRAGAPRGERVLRAVVAVVRGNGLAALCSDAGAVVVGSGEEIPDAIRRAHAREVVLLPNDADLREAAGAAADQARAEGVRVALIPTRSAVQGIAALAVHEPARRFDEDVVAMTSAAGATRYAELGVAERESWTSAGICQAGDILGLIDGDVAVIGGNLVETGAIVLDRMLAAGGEMVTLVLGSSAPPDLAERLETHVRDGYLAVDTVVYHGGEAGCPLLIGVE